MTFVEILGVADIVLIVILVAGTLLGYIDWSDPKGLK